MIVPDANLLLYAYDKTSPFHTKAKHWWEQCLSGYHSHGRRRFSALQDRADVLPARRLIDRPPLRVSRAGEGRDHGRAHPLCPPRLRRDPQRARRSGATKTQSPHSEARRNPEPAARVPPMPWG
jgi:hypothetical protein